MCHLDVYVRALYVVCTCKTSMSPACSSANNPMCASHEALLPTRAVDDETHENARDETSHGHRDEPAEVDPRDHPPVDCPPVAVAEADTYNGTGDALRCRDGKLCRPISMALHDQAPNIGSIPRRVATMTVMTEPSSMEKPRAGDMSVTRLPRFRMM